MGCPQAAPICLACQCKTCHHYLPAKLGQDGLWEYSQPSARMESAKIVVLYCLGGVGEAAGALACPCLCFCASRRGLLWAALVAFWEVQVEMGMFGKRSLQAD
jgi:hypothetical protein